MMTLKKVLCFEGNMLLLLIIDSCTVSLIRGSAYSWTRFITHFPHWTITMLHRGVDWLLDEADATFLLIALTADLNSNNINIPTISIIQVYTK